MLGEKFQIEKKRSNEFGAMIRVRAKVWRSIWAQNEVKDIKTMQQRQGLQIRSQYVNLAKQKVLLRCLKFALLKSLSS